ncbi:MAG: family 16 glycosylhydrolase [Chloroflexales bacterium]|nr:family 16 glycosylhydrolase [Chloroflexales bacterium]
MMHHVCQGQASIDTVAPGHYRLGINSDGTGYSNAQLDDYHHRPRRDYPWQAPVRLSLWAKVPMDAQGTYGFGFWNAPHSPLASTLETRTWQALLIGMWAPLLLLLMKIPTLYASLLPRLTPRLRLAEQMLVPDDTWHHYQIDWQPDSVTWRIDGQVVHQTASAPCQPMGLCIWIDNQWLAVGPRGRWGWGLCADTAVLEVRDVLVDVV